MISSFLLQQFDESHSIGNMAHYHLRTGGKCLRGRLALCEAKEQSIDIDKAVLWAAACELLHNATLIHDDIQDNDPIRRGQPSLWKQFGIPQAINVGDYFIFKSFRLASQLENANLTLILAQASETLVKGQSEELAMPSSQQKQYWDTYLRVARLKTSILFQLPIEGIHLLKHESMINSYDYVRGWSQLGIAYQIFDDINDFLGLKQEGQRQKDFDEKRVNSIVAYISQDRIYRSLIQDYLNPDVTGGAHQKTILQLHEITMKENVLQSLRQYASNILDQFKKKPVTEAKKLILGEVRKILNKGLQDAQI